MHKACDHVLCVYARMRVTLVMEILDCPYHWTRGYDMRYSLKEIRSYVKDTLVPHISADVDPDGYIICVSDTIYAQREKTIYIMGAFDKDYISRRMSGIAFKTVGVGPFSCMVSVVMKQHSLSRVIFAHDPIAEFRTLPEQSHVLYELAHLIPMHDTLGRINDMHDRLVDLGGDYWIAECNAFIAKKLDPVRLFFKAIAANDKVNAQLQYQPTVESLLRLLFLSDYSPYPPPTLLMHSTRQHFPNIHVMLNSYHKDYLHHDINVDQMRFCVKELLWSCEIMLKEMGGVDVTAIEVLANK